MSRPGRALVGWLRWIQEGYPQRLLVEMISEGLLNCGDDDLSFCWDTLAKMAMNNHSRGCTVFASVSTVSKFGL